LLKILSRITEPTEGRVRIRGRVASLLEVGTGFHSELTGRENIFVNGAILGMTRREIQKKFDEIVAFAEVERFLDTPVKRYSSGMYVRLAFAVAAHLEPEILIIDEVLAVGDTEFQKKCLGKMQNVAEREGRTVLFVSHNMGAITRLCRRSLWLDDGMIAFDGSSRDATNRYQSRYLSASAEWRQSDPETSARDFMFLSVTSRNSEGGLSSLFRGDEDIAVDIRYMVRRQLTGCQIGTRVYNSDGVVVFSTADADNSASSALPKEPGRYQAVFSIPSYFLAPGTYRLQVASHLPFRETYEVIEEAVIFEISEAGSLTSLDGRLGVVTPRLQWRTSREGLE
jgi:lipopolysaccharide transport system ATP-binding protein